MIILRGLRLKIIKLIYYEEQQIWLPMRQAVFGNCFSCVLRVGANRM